MLEVFSKQAHKTALTRKVTTLLNWLKTFSDIILQFSHELLQKNFKGMRKICKIIY